MTKPGKQRKLMYQAPQHIQRKLMSAPLSSTLIDRYGAKRLPLRKGDTVKILRGDFSGIEGKLTKVDREKQRVYVEGVTKEKVSGQQTNVSVHASKVMITSLNLDDKWRSESLKEKGKITPEEETGTG